MFCIPVEIFAHFFQGETLNSSDATATFFATTKLFQSRDPQLRRLVYLLICELAGLASDVIIVTSSLTKDMTGKEDLFRAPAMRALARITDVRNFINFFLFHYLIIVIHQQ